MKRFMAVLLALMAMMIPSFADLSAEEGTEQVVLSSEIVLGGGDNPTTFIVRDENGEGYWEIEIIDEPVYSPQYEADWGYTSFNKTVSCTYNDSGNSNIARMSARFSGYCNSGGAGLTSVSNGTISSYSYNATGSSYYEILQSHSTSSSAAHARYRQICSPVGGGESRPISLHVYLSSTGHATVTITIG